MGIKDNSLIGSFSINKRFYMKKNYFPILIILLFVIGESYSQRTENAIYFSNENARIVLEVENDILFNTDSYYTSGQALSYTNKKFNKTPAQFLLKLITKKEANFTGIGLQQKIFTPYSIKQPNLVANDRPYSAYFLLSNYSVSINLENKTIVSNEIAIGAMGSIAMGEQSQKFVHKIIHSPTPVGWENQLNNAFLIDYTFRVEKSFFSGFASEHVIPYIETRVGTLTDRVKIGFKIRFGNKNKSMVNLAKGNYDGSKIIWEWIFRANLQGVFYDATLEGGLFNKEETVELPVQDIIERQYQLRMGLNFYYKNLSLRYMIYYNSKDFRNGLVHKYGSVNLGYSF